MTFFWGGVGFVIALALARWLSEARFRLAILDHPNARSLHQQPTPRTGGIAIMAAVTVAGAGVLIQTHPRGGWLWLLAGLVLVAVVSFLDDRGGVPPAYRLAVQFAAAGMLAKTGLLSVGGLLPGIDLALPPWLDVTCALLFVVWMTNLYNFMDGMDGFAGGMTLVGFGCFALFGALATDHLFTALSLVVAAAGAGFLWLNFPPARIFMGDLGASSIGFLAAAFSLWGASAEIMPLWAAVLVFSPFIGDASVTLTRRLLRGERVWEAHCSHYYQRLVRLGWGHRKTVLWEYLLMVLCALSALAAQAVSVQIQWAIITFWLLTFVLLMQWVRRLERGRGNRGVHGR